MNTEAKDGDVDNDINDDPNLDTFVYGETAATWSWDATVTHVSLFQSFPISLRYSFLIPKFASTDERLDFNFQEVAKEP